jgi:hypothetical protein
MSRKPPPATDADRWELSRAMLTLADQAEAIWAELAAQGYDRPSAILRAAQLDFADRVANREGLRAYWREMAREQLSALDSTFDKRGGHVVAPYAYRSPLIAELRSKAHLLPSAPGRSSPQIEPALKAWVEEIGTTYADKEGLLALARHTIREAATGLCVPERPEFAGLDWHGRMRLQRLRYAQTLVPAGFELVAPSRSFTHFRRTTTDGKYVFSLLDDFKAMGMQGNITTQFAITSPGASIVSVHRMPVCLAEFSPGTVVPEFQWSSHFEPNSWPELCLATDTVACLTTVLFRRLDAALQNRSI